MHNVNVVHCIWGVYHGDIAYGRAQHWGWRVGDTSSIDISYTQFNPLYTIQPISS